MKFAGLFAGLTTVDIQYYVDRFPASNKKVKTGAPELMAGGPATNAAVAFAQLNGGAYLASATGRNSFSDFISSDFTANKIMHFNLTNSLNSNPVLASVVTSADTGDRNIFTHHPDKIASEISGKQLYESVNPQVVMLDGFYPEVSVEIASTAKKAKVPVILDCGSWKPQYEELLPVADIAVCSEDFIPPGCRNLNEVVVYLTDAGIKKSAVSRGEKNVVFYDSGKRGEVGVERTEVIDTLGAGDFLHGAFCYFFLLLNNNFEEALRQAVRFATFTCRFKGTRSWINYLKDFHQSENNA